jgi:hypothetical protein
MLEVEHGPAVSQLLEDGGRMDPAIPGTPWAHTRFPVQRPVRQSQAGAAPAPAPCRSLAWHAKAQGGPRHGDAELTCPLSALVDQIVPRGWSIGEDGQRARADHGAAAAAGSRAAAAAAR